MSRTFESTNIQATLLAFLYIVYYEIERESSISLILSTLLLYFTSLMLRYLFANAVAHRRLLEIQIIVTLLSAPLLSSLCVLVPILVFERFKNTLLYAFSAGVVLFLLDVNMRSAA
ncbi:MAG: hypothetical protein ACRC5C_08445, partial [Bacilli bacterium]